MICFCMTTYPSHHSLACWVNRRQDIWKCQIGFLDVGVILPPSVYYCLCHIFPSYGPIGGLFSTLIFDPHMVLQRISIIIFLSGLLLNHSTIHSSCRCLMMSHEIESLLCPPFLSGIFVKLILELVQRSPGSISYWEKFTHCLLTCFNLNQLPFTF